MRAAQQGQGTKQGEKTTTAVDPQALQAQAPAQPAPRESNQSQPIIIPSPAGETQMTPQQGAGAQSELQPPPQPECQPEARYEPQPQDKALPLISEEDFQPLHDVNTVPQAQSQPRRKRIAEVESGQTSEGETEETPFYVKGLENDKRRRITTFDFNALVNREREDEFRRRATPLQSSEGEIVTSGPLEEPVNSSQNEIPVRIDFKILERNEWRVARNVLFDPGIPEKAIEVAIDYKSRGFSLLNTKYTREPL